jgi:hypothetical protein
MTDPRLLWEMVACLWDLSFDKRTVEIREGPATPQYISGSASISYGFDGCGTAGGLAYDHNQGAPQWVVCFVSHRRDGRITPSYVDFLFMKSRIDCLQPL